MAITVCFALGVDGRSILRKRPHQYSANRLLGVLGKDINVHVLIAAHVSTLLPHACLCALTCLP